MTAHPALRSLLDRRSELPAGLLMPEGDHVQGRGLATGLLGRGGNHGAIDLAGPALGLDVIGKVHGRATYQNGYPNATPIREYPVSVCRVTISGMDAKTARTLNIRLWVAAEGGPTEFSGKYGGTKWSTAQVSQWISASNPKSIGGALARAIEAKLKLPKGAMDHAPDSQSVRLTGAKIARAVTLARKSVEAKGMDDFDPEDEADAEVVAAAFDYLESRSVESVTSDEVLQFMRAISERENERAAKSGQAGGTGRTASTAKAGGQGGAAGGRKRQSA